MFLQIFINSIIAGSIYALMALSFSLIYSSTKFFNMAHGTVAVAGGYIVFFLIKSFGWNAPLSIILGIFGAGLLGLLLNIAIFEPLKKRHSSNVALLVASLGAMTVIQSLLAIIFTNQFQTFEDSSTVNKIYFISNAVITQTQIYIFVAALCSFILLILLLKYTKFGKMTRALNDSEEVAAIVGINTKKMIRYIFFIGSALAGLAGILVGYDTGLEPIMGMHLLLKGVIAAIMGGANSLGGVLTGSFLLGIAENFGIWKISGEWKDAIAFVLLIIFLLFRPRGIFKK